MTVTEIKHRWSGWPGAWCLDCGVEDPVELCAADGHPMDCTQEKCQPTECPEPNSHNHDPYWEAEQRDERLKKLAAKVKVMWTEWNDPL